MRRFSGTYSKERDGRYWRPWRWSGILQKTLTASMFITALGFEAVSSSEDQIVLKPSTKPRKLHGRFLQITDLHPDRFYVPGASSDSSCHSLVSQKHSLHFEDSKVGKYGASLSGCDSPLELINATFAWIEEKLKDGIDFVIWTGDNSRHDNDINRPRDTEEVWGMNELMVQKMKEVFANKSEDGDDSTFRIPIVPTIGNNDILPHNIMFPGPTPTIQYYLNLWKDFIPSSQYHTFSRGAYFWKQVIPGSPPYGRNLGHGGLAVISLNTLYTFQKNAAIDGCDIEGEAGTLMMEWLRAQLQLMREENMKAIIIGHVPPSRVKNHIGDDWRKRLWDESCWKKYILYARQYRDVIVGGIYGHMNIDHFLIDDSDNVIAELENWSQPSDLQSEVRGDVHSSEEKYTAFSAGDYLQSVRSHLAKVAKAAELKMSRKPRRSKKFKNDLDYSLGENFVLTLVSSSVVPNFYPSLRVYTYNTTNALPKEFEGMFYSKVPTPGSDARPTTKDKSKKDIPPPPPKNAGPGPAYAPQTFSLTGLTQYFANITKYNRENEALRYDLLYDTQKDELGYGGIFKDGLLVKNYIKLTRGLVDARKIKRGSLQHDFNLYEVIPNEAANGEEWDDDARNSTKFSISELESRPHIEKKKKTPKPRKRRHGGRIPPRDRIWETFLWRAFSGSVSKETLTDI